MQKSILIASGLFVGGTVSYGAIKNYFFNDSTSIKNFQKLGDIYGSPQDIPFVKRIHKVKCDNPKVVNEIHTQNNCEQSEDKYQTWLGSWF